MLSSDLAGMSSVRHRIGGGWHFRHQIHVQKIYLLKVVVILPKYCSSSFGSVPFVGLIYTTPLAPIQNIKKNPEVLK